MHLYGLDVRSSRDNFHHSNKYCITDDSQYARQYVLMREKDHTGIVERYEYPVRNSNKFFKRITTELNKDNWDVEGLIRYELNVVDKTNYKLFVDHKHKKAYLSNKQPIGLGNEVMFYHIEHLLSRKLGLVVKDWEQATSYEDACILTIDALHNGEETPWNIGMDEETYPLLDILYFLNGSKLLTIDSQPGICEGDIKQRAYINCFASEAVTNELIKLDLGVVYYNYNKHMVTINKPAKSLIVADKIHKYIPLTLENDEVFTSLPIDTKKRHHKYDTDVFNFKNMALKQYDCAFPGAEHLQQYNFLVIMFPKECNDSLFEIMRNVIQNILH